MKESVIMPNGKPFEFWDDTTEYIRVYHVAYEHPDASDEGPGTESQPFKTINRAANVLQPGEKVIVHSGVYRECEYTNDEASYGSACAWWFRTR